MYTACELKFVLNVQIIFSICAATRVFDLYELIFFTQFLYTIQWLPSFPTWSFFLLNLKPYCRRFLPIYAFYDSASNVGSDEWIETANEYYTIIFTCTK